MLSNQAEFFDHHPGLYPWPQLLRQEGFNRVFKLKDAKFLEILDLMGLEKGRRVLDLGCGDGVLLERIVRTYQVLGTGVDISRLSIKRAKKDSCQGIKYLVADAAKLPFKAESFDCIFSFDSLEHIRAQKKALAEMVRVLRPGGQLLIYALNKNQDYTWNWWLAKLGIDIYQKYDHDPALFLNPIKVKQELKKLGLRIGNWGFFHAFFTLLTDEIVMVLISLFLKLNFFKNKSLGELFLGTTNLFTRLFLPVLEYLDQPWTKKSRANGFYLVAKKEKK